jgi:hypothetical protein
MVFDEIDPARIEFKARSLDRWCITNERRVNGPTGAVSVGCDPKPINAEGLAISGPHSAAL